ncbi:MAG: hypothetical protein GOV15_03255 [Candidatus Diapherotrites archaeon]|nr:hypothetical protein [Candidatus Diapherotrites archaeon]
MFSAEDLQFAYKYPFSKEAAKIVKSLDVSLDDVPEDLFSRAEGVVFSLAKGNKVNLALPDSSSSAVRDFLSRLVLARIIVGSSDSEVLKSRFSTAISTFSFSFLSKEVNLLDVALAFLETVDISENKDYSCKIGLNEFLKYPLRINELRLVNNDVSGGFVYLTKDRLALFLRNLGFWLTYNSFARSYKGVPKKFAASAKAAKEFTYSSTATFKLKPGTKFQPELMCSCMLELYKKLSEGLLPSHYGNVAIATFLLSLGVPEEDVVQLYKRSPKFNEGTARYQLRFLAGKMEGSTKYSAPSCRKMEAWGLCLKDPLCQKLRHPLSHYAVKAGWKKPGAKGGSSGK